MERRSSASLAEVGGVVTGPVIQAAGGVVWRSAAPANGADVSLEVAIIHRPRYDDWSLPKGKLAVGESHLEAAVREVLEETGFHVRVGRPLGETRYNKVTAGASRPKVIRWWAMRAEEGAFSATREVDALRWVSLADAAALARPTDRDVLERFARGAAPTRTVLLVRHASAGSRSAWSGDDRERPLDECGIAQADELIRVLTRYEVGRIVSANLRRCIDTIEPLAAALDLAVEPVAVLSEVAYLGHEAEAVALVRQLAEPEHDAVACSQGDVIPDLLGRLAAADGFDIEIPIKTGKGSTWALSLDLDGRLVAADYLAPPRLGPCSETSQAPLTPA